MKRAGTLFAQVVLRIPTPDEEARIAALVSALEDAATFDDDELHAAITLTRKRALRLLTEDQA